MNGYRLCEDGIGYIPPQKNLRFRKFWVRISDDRSSEFEHWSGSAP